MPTTSDTIAVLGASTDRQKFGNKCVRAYLQAGYEVYPVNPREDAIEGLRVYRRLEEIPIDLDRISIYLPPVITERLLSEIASTNAGQVWFNPGSADASILAGAAALGIAVRDGCSIVDVGMSPADFG